jgi:hypothetical protein
MLVLYARDIQSITTDTGPVSVYVQGRYAYVVNATSNSLQIFDMNNPLAPIKVGTSTPTDTTPSCISVQGRYAYVTNQGSSTLQIFDIGNPAAPFVAGSIGTSTTPKALFIQGHYVYVINASTPVLEIFDVGDPTKPTSVGSIATNADPRSLYVKGAYAYVVCGNSATLQIFNTSDPKNPSVASTVTTGSGTIPTALYVQNGYAYIVNTGSSDLLQIFAVNDPNNPSLVNSIATFPHPQAVYVQGMIAYILSGTDNSLQLFDVKDPTLITGIESMSTGNDPISLFVQGRFAYVVNFTSNTLQAIDLIGVYILKLEAGGAEVGTLHTRENATINNDLDVRGSATFGCGFNATGNSAIFGTATITGPASSPALNVTAGAANLASAPKLLNLLVAASVDNLQINGSTGELFRPSSTRKVKENFRAINSVSSGIYDLNPVIFDFKPNHGGAKDQLGFIAEEVSHVFPTVVNYEADGSPRSIKYDCLHAPTIKELQNHQKKLESHEDIIATLIKKIEALQAQLACIRKKNE